MGQEQLVNAGEDIRAALARAAFKALTAQTATNALTGNSGNGSSGDGGQALLSFAGKLLMQLTDAAETRNWLLLPNEIRLRRVALEPGDKTTPFNNKSLTKKRKAETANPNSKANQLSKGI